MTSKLFGLAACSLVFLVSTGQCANTTAAKRQIMDAVYCDGHEDQIFFVEQAESVSEESMSISPSIVTFDFISRKTTEPSINTLIWRQSFPSIRSVSLSPRWLVDGVCDSENKNMTHLLIAISHGRNISLNIYAIDLGTRVLENQIQSNVEDQSKPIGTLNYKFSIDDCPAESAHLIKEGTGYLIGVIKDPRWCDTGLFRFDTRNNIWYTGSFQGNKISSEE